PLYVDMLSGYVAMSRGGATRISNRGYLSNAGMKFARLIGTTHCEQAGSESEHSSSSDFDDDDITAFLARNPTCCDRSNGGRIASPLRGHPEKRHMGQPHAGLWE